MRLLISDANILIDIEHGNLTSAVFCLPYEITVPDVLFELELKEKHSHLLTIGLKVKSLTSVFVKKIEDLRTRYPQPSIMDHMALALAQQENCPLLTGDKALRTAAKIEGVEVHGTIWIVEQLLTRKLIEHQTARNGFESMKNQESRLPWDAVEKLLISTNTELSLKLS